MYLSRIVRKLRVIVFVHALAHIGGVAALLTSYFVVTSASAMSYTPPTTITVTMYRLNANGGLFSPLTLCGPATASQFGCTADATLGSYPFGSTNPVTVQIEGTATNNRYLRDVVPREMGPATVPSEALRAQAIAARTYAYYHIRKNNTINNSTGFQVFIPRTYDALPLNIYRQQVDAALLSRYYMSYYTGFNDGSENLAADDPIFSEFSADALLSTVTHPEQNKYPYMISVPEPISYAGANVGHRRGMSQNGAGRWANGTSQPTPGSGTPWSVKLTRVEQLLTHYYTRIHVRNAASSNALVTPPDRWIPLRIVTPGYTICRGNGYPMAVRVQNTGTTTWNANQVSLVVLNSSPLSETTIPTSIAPGGTYTVSVVAQTPSNTTPGSTYFFSLNMKKNGSSFSTQSPSWPNYSTNGFTVVVCKFSYIPRLDQEGPPVAGE